MRALVLSGGGGKGAYQVGALTYLMRHPDYRAGFEIICGTSVGAVNALGLAHYPPKSFDKAVAWIESLWTVRITGTSDIWKHRFPKYLAGLWRPSIGKTDPLDRLLRSVVDQNQIRGSGIVLRLPAVDLVTGRTKVFDELADDLVTAAMASASFPMVFPPVETPEGTFTDGGVRDIAPLKQAVDAGADEILVITTDNPSGHELDSAPTTVLGMALRTVDLLTNEVLLGDLRSTRLYNRLVEAGLEKTKRRISVRVLWPSESLGDPLDFSPDLIQERLELGRKDAAKRFPRKVDRGFPAP